MRPAGLSLRTRTDAIVHAIEAACAAVERHVRDATGSETSAPLAQAQSHLNRALRLLESQPSRKPEPARPGRTPSKPSQDVPDDLTRIRGIDAKAVDRLQALGISRFEQIAAWEPEDVRTIGQALDLGRSFQNNGVIDQAKMLLAPPEMFDVMTEDGVAGWRPHAALSETDSISAPAPLSVEQLAVVHAILRRGPTKTELSTFATLAPQLAHAVAVPTCFGEVCDEAPWRPSPLLETATPVVAEALPAADAPTVVATRDTVSDTVAADEGPTDVSVPAPVLTAPVLAAPVLAAPVLIADEPPTPQPVHVVTLDRLAALDAEISALGAQPETEATRPVPARDVLPVTVRPTIVPSTPSTPDDTVLARKPPARRMTPLSSATEEADVTIKSRSSRSAPVLQPLSELPLRPKRKPLLIESNPDAPTEVSEAAVVIVKRRARERAAPDLEFYRPSEAAELAS